MESAIAVAFQLVILIFSVVIHEVSHGLAAQALGDPTARYAGRLTLNPLRHLDPVGSFFVPLASFLLGGIVIGWAKPVPYNPYLLRVRNREIGSAVVGAAGPAANIALALLFGLAVRSLNVWTTQVGALGPPLIEITSAIVLTNLFLAVFNLVPIPPLDGSKVLFSLLPAEWHALRVFLEHYGFLLLLVFIFSFAGLITPLVGFLFRVLTGIAW